jgi:hypothetical protein
VAATSRNQAPSRNQPAATMSRNHTQAQAPPCNQSVATTSHNQILSHNQHVAATSQCQDATTSQVTGALHGAAAAYNKMVEPSDAEASNSDAEASNSDGSDDEAEADNDEAMP